MSRHGPRRAPPFDTGLRPAGRGYCGSGSDSGTSRSAEGALGILSGCGLEPARSAFLARLPEESPPHLVRLGKSNGEAFRPPRVSSARLPSWPKPPVGCRNGDPSQSVRYALDRVEQTPLPAERLHRGPGPSLSTRNFAASVSSLPSLPRDRPSAPRASGRWGSGSERARSSSQLAGAATPSEREARDFHGAEPQTYPTSCSLCNACVISAENWTTHINSGRHADGQLGLLQRFPTWDCRMETLDRADRQSEKRTRKDGGPLRRTDESKRSQPTSSSEKKPAHRGKVACVKFAAGSVDKPHLRKLTEPFGTVTRMLVFPSLAFVELESAEQAQELVKFHKRRPPTASGQRLDFSISNTFNFVKRSRVVSFTPPPQSDDDKSELLAVVKRFGAPVYTLFCRSEACVEMKSLEDAEKLVNSYARDDLRLNGKVLRVSFAAETSTLRTAASAQRYREESTERTGSREEERVPEESEERRARGRKGGDGDARAGSPSADREARSRSREKTCRSGALTADAEKPETTASGGAAAAPKDSGGEQGRSDTDADSEQDASDIEGMAVLGEDLEDERLETEEEADERMAEGEERQVGGDSPEALPDVLSSSHSNWGNAQDGPASGKAPPVASDAGKNTTQDGNAHSGQSKDEKAPTNKSEAGKTLDIPSDNGATPEAPSQGGKTAQVKPQGGETRQAKETRSDGRHPLQDESEARKRRKEESESQRRNSPQRESKCRKTDECDSEAAKAAADDVLFWRVSQRVSAEDPGSADSRQEDNSAETLKRRASPGDACARGKIQKEEQRSQTPAESDDNQETSGTPATPLRPIGTEFVRPVVGYFCNLCQAIYADEDEAKVRHCSSRRHHLKYREKMELAT